MEIYLVRHGRAEDREAWDSGSDHLRPLTPDGIRRMRLSANTMRTLGVKPGIILTSPLVRARQTADIVADALRCPVKEFDGLANFGVGVLADLLAAYADTDRLLLVGHEPDFSSVVEMVTGGHVVVKKGSLIRISLYSARPPRGHLLWCIPPRALVACGN